MMYVCNCKYLIVLTTHFTKNPALEITEKKLLAIKMSTKQIIEIKSGNLGKFPFNE